jgi:hypothetical protein
MFAGSLAKQGSQILLGLELFDLRERLGEVKYLVLLVDADGGFHRRSTFKTDDYWSFRRRMAMMS